MTDFKVVKALPPNARASVREEQVDWAGAKTALIDNAGEWVCIAENVHSSTVTQLRAGKYAQFQGAELENFEFASRRPTRAREGAGSDDWQPYGPRRTDVYGLYTAPKKGAKK